MERAIIAAVFLLLFSLQAAAATSAGPEIFGAQSKTESRAS
jgi:hypothetical protein